MHHPDDDRIRLSLDDTMTEAEIIETSRRFGLEVREARLVDGLLELIPARPVTFPGAEDLRALADALRGGDVRWVTVLIEEEA